MLHPPSGGVASEQPGERHDKVLSTSFQYSDWETPGVPRLYLIISYLNGFQIWRVDDGVTAVEVLSERVGVPIRIVKFVVQPFDELDGDPFFRQRPLLAAVSADGSNAQWSNKTVRFYSLAHCSWGQQLSLHFDILDVFATRQLFVVQHPEHLAIFHPVNMYEIQQVKYCNAGLSPTLAIGSKWIAFPSMKRVPAAEAELFSPWQLVSYAGSAVLSGINSIAAAAHTHIRNADDFGVMGSHYPRAAAADAHLHNGSSSSSGTSSSGVPSRASEHVGASDPLALMAAGAVEVCEFSAATNSLRTISHFQAHSEAIANLTFSPDGSLLATVDRSGTECRIFMVLPHQHLYTLTRGLTRASIQSITFSHNSRWVAMCSSNGTAHIFPINPHGGGKVNVFTHGPQCLDYQNQIEARLDPNQPPEFMRPYARLKLSTAGDAVHQRLGLSFVHYQEQRYPAVLVADATGLLSQHTLITGIPPADPMLDKTLLLIDFEHVAEWDLCRREAWELVRPANVPPVAQRSAADDFWLAYVETATHAPKQNELWRSPRFTFKEFIATDDQQQAFLHSDRMFQATTVDASKLRDEYFEERPTTPVVVRNSAPTAYHEGGAGSPGGGFFDGGQSSSARAAHMRTSGNGLAAAMQTQRAAAPSNGAQPLSYEEKRALDYRRLAASPSPSARPGTTDAWTAEDLLSRRPSSSDPMRRSFTFEDTLPNPALAQLSREREAAAAAGYYHLAGRSSPQHGMAGYPHSPSAAAAALDPRRVDPTTRDIRSALYNPAITDPRDQRYVSSAVTPDSRAIDPRTALLYGGSSSDRRSADPRYDIPSDRRSSNDAYAALLAQRTSGTSDPRYAGLSGGDRTRSDPTIDARYAALAGRPAGTSDPRYAALPSGGDRSRDPTIDARYAALAGRSAGTSDPRYAALPGGDRPRDPTIDPRYPGLTTSDPRSRASDPAADPRYAALPGGDRPRSSDPTSDPRYAAVLGGDRPRSSDPTTDPRYAGRATDPTRDPRYAGGVAGDRARTADPTTDPRYAAMGRTTSGPAAEAEARSLQEQATRAAAQPRPPADQERERALSLLSRLQHARAGAAAPSTDEAGTLRAAQELLARSPDGNALSAAMQTRR